MNLKYIRLKMGWSSTECSIQLWVSRAPPAQVLPSYCPPPLGPDGLQSFSGRLVVGGTSILIVIIDLSSSAGPLLGSPALWGHGWWQLVPLSIGATLPWSTSLGCPPWWMKQDSLVCLSSGWLCETGEKREKGKTDWHLGISDALLRRVAFAIPAIFFFVSKIACFLKNRALWPQRAWILPRWKSKRLYFLCVGQTTINWVIGYTGDQVIRYTGATARPMKRNTKHHWNWL